MAKSEALYRIGDIYVKKEEQEKAIEVLEKLMEAKPKNSDFRVVGLINLATIYEEKESWKDAVRVYSSISKSGGNKQYVDGAVSRIGEIKAAFPDMFPSKNTKKK